MFASSSNATIHYSVSLARPEDQIFRVTMTVPGVEKELTVQMPAWNGLYQIRDFAQRVQNVRATDADGRELAVRKSDKQTWHVTGAGAIRIEYGILWDEPGAFSSEFNTSHAFLNLATVLFYVPTRRREDVRLEFVDVPAGWGIATALPAGPTSTSFTAPSYDAVVDAPVEVSAFEQWTLEAGKARVRIVVHGQGRDREQLSDAVRRIIAYQTEMMRDVPFEEFLILYHFGVGGGGGMEHANSTAIFLGANAPPAWITAHEVFHLWNVKRIRPKTLEPGCSDGGSRCGMGSGVDYTRENWTRALWFAEGVTSTYGAFTMVRTGLWTPRQFYDDLGRQIGELQSRPARLWRSAEEASLDAWFEKYALYSRPAFSISYYNKGQLLGTLLDILIRDATDNRASLDDVLRDLNERFARRGRFYDERSDLRASAERIAGRSFEEFFQRYVSGTDELPFNEVLALAGLELSTQRSAPAGTGRSRGVGVVESAQASEKQIRIREGLLRGSTAPAASGRP